MMRKLTLVFIALFGFLAAAQAQPECAFDKQHHYLLNNDPAYAARFNQMNAEVAAILSSSSSPSLIVNTANGPVYEIPVVIHVMHTGGAVGTPYNPADTVLQNMITYLNQVYQATYFAYPNASSGGTYFPVQFALAQRDPNCNATTGIERINASASLGTAYTNKGVNRDSTTGVSDGMLKALSIWNHLDYYNIWVVNKIDNNDGTGTGTFVAGYAQMPPAASSTDGTIMLASQSKTGKVTLPHEIGHAFGLLHTFEGDDPTGTGAATTCPANTNCNTDGDMVCDTEPMKRTLSSCPSSTSTNACTGVNWNYTQNNIMNYSTCMDRLTSGQKTRFVALLNGQYRASLISSLGATALGTAPASVTCIPTISFPFLASAYDAGPTAVLLNDLKGYTDGGFGYDGNNVYLDRACWQRANLTAGQSYTLSVKTGINRERVRVYMDYNNDGVFNATTELVYSHDGSAGSAGSYETHSGTITIPTTGITTCAPIRMRVVSDLYAASSAPTPCGALDYGQAEDYSVFIKPAPPSVITIALATGSSNPSCSGTTVGFTASYTGTPSSPTVRWYLNGVYQSVTGSSYSSNAFVNGDQVTAKLFFTGACGSDSTVSNTFTLTRSANVAPAVSISVTAGSNPGCAGQSITFTATPTNGGTAPTYKWYVGTMLQTGVTGATFTTSSLACNSTVYAVLTSNSTCATTTTATSNTITYTCGTQAISVTIAITGGSNPTCAGRAVTFSATPVNGGTAPTYKWYVNGVLQTGNTGSTFTTSTLANGDSVYAVLTSNFSCAATPTAQSPAIYETVVANLVPTVTKTITAGSNPGCKDSLIQWTATTTNSGATPTFRWYLNGLPVATGSVYNNYTAVTGDRVWVRAIVTPNPAACYARDTAYSDTTTLTRLPTPALPVISFIGHQLVSDSFNNIQWYGPAGLLPGATGQTYTPTVQGDYYVIITNPLCGTGKSNVLTVSPLSIGTYNMAGVSMFPNPTTGMLTISWASPSTARITVYTPSGQAVLHEAATVATRKVIDLSRLAAGTYFVMLQDESGRTGMMRVTVAH